MFRSFEDGVEVIDLESLNGVRVNDVPVQISVRLSHRDRIQVGAHVFVLLDSDLERKEIGPTTKVSPLRAAARARLIPSFSALDSAEHALDNEDTLGATRLLESCLAHLPPEGAPPSDSDLRRLGLLLVRAAVAAHDFHLVSKMFDTQARYWKPLHQDVLDAIFAAASNFERASTDSVHSYLAAMQRRPTTDPPLSTEEQVRLRRIEALARRLNKGAS